MQEKGKPDSSRAAAIGRLPPQPPPILPLCYRVRSVRFWLVGRIIDPISHPDIKFPSIHSVVVVVVALYNVHMAKRLCVHSHRYPLVVFFSVDHVC